MASFILRLLLLTVLSIQEHMCQSFVYHIKASENTNCHAKCLTLSEFASTLRNSSDTDIMLNILPGDHCLNVNLSISNVANISIHSDNATIVCESNVHFVFESIEKLAISNMKFIGCGNNLVSNVSDFLLRESTFKGLSGTGTALILVNTTAADVVDCTFVDNQYGTPMETVESLKVLITNVVWLTVRNVSGTLRVGGVLVSIHSNVSINQCKFENNAAEIGGDIFAESDSKISVFNSSFTGIRGGPQLSSEESLFG